MTARRTKNTAYTPMSDDEIVSWVNPRPMLSPADAAKLDAEAIMRRHAGSMRAALSKLTLNA